MIFSMMNLLWVMGGFRGPPGEWLFRFFRSDAERDASVQWQGFDLDIEAVTVGMCPCRADARPVALVGIPVAHMVGDVAGCFGSGGLFLSVSHFQSPFCFQAAPIAA